MPYGEKVTNIVFDFFKFEKRLFYVLLTCFFSFETMTEDIVYQSTGTKCALSFCKNIYTENGEEGQILFFNFPEDPVR